MVKEPIDKIRDLMVQARTSTIGFTGSVFYINRQGNAVFHESRACHAAMRSENALESLVKHGIGTMINITGLPKEKIPSVKSLFEFLISEDSPYIAVIKAAGIVPLWDDNDVPLGYYAPPQAAGINLKALHNFFKTVRAFGEHSYSLDFWEKYKDKGPKGVVYLLSFYYGVSGERKTNGHGPIETSKFDNGIDLRKFLTPYGGRSWFSGNLPSDYKSQTPTYSGEQTHMWGPSKTKSVLSSFDPHKNIVPRGMKVGVKTRFYSKYLKTPDVMSEEGFLSFFQDLKEGVYG